jgi:hypothetical protein
MRNQRAAAEHLADDRLTDVQIAKLAGVSRAALSKWEKIPTFMQRVEDIRERAAKKLEAKSLEDRQYRLEQLKDRHNALLALVKARGSSGEMVGVPGGETGFVIRRTRVVGVGATAEHVTENVLDTGLLDMFLKIEKQAPQEMGQWTEKSDLRANVAFPNNVLIYLPTKDSSPELDPPQKRVTDVIEHE